MVTRSNNADVLDPGACAARDALAGLAVAQRLECSAGPGATVSRLDSDKNRRDAMALARTLMAEVSRPHRINGHELLISCSVGLALYPEDGNTPDTLLFAAAGALTACKSAGAGLHRAGGAATHGAQGDRLQLAIFLDLELTETLRMSDRVQTAATLHALRALGVRMSPDGFGTGYSNLSSLHRLPISSLKIDRSFLHDLPQRADALAIVGAIISMAHSLGAALDRHPPERALAAIPKARTFFLGTGLGVLLANGVDRAGVRTKFFAAASGELVQVEAAQLRPTESPSIFLPVVAIIPDKVNRTGLPVQQCVERFDTIAEYQLHSRSTTKYDANSIFNRRASAALQPIPFTPRTEGRGFSGQI